MPGDPTRPAPHDPSVGHEDEFRLQVTRPERHVKAPPCQAGCPAGGDVRGWLGIFAQREKLGLSEEEARLGAWNVLAARNPMPATTGRVCPHPCESACNRGDHDGPVSINALERFVGDWSLERGVSLPRENDHSHPESIGVVGSGPAGLSFAYQMARRGYPVTVYEKHDRPGGMLTYGIPEYRLPAAVVDAEIERIFDLGIRLELGVAVGSDVSVEELHRRHAVVFLGIGAQRGRLLQIDGESGPGVWGGTAYLELVNSGRPVSLGSRVVVVGGGNTAIDAARTARRAGAEVTLIYRRTRQEMPAISDEVDDALVEGVVIEYLTAPVAIVRSGSDQDAAVRAVRVQAMQLGAPDAGGRRSPVPVPGAFREICADSVIAAVSQEPDWTGLENVERSLGASAASPDAWIDRDLLAGGDVLGLGLVSLALGHGRAAAEAVHARLRGLAPPAPSVAAGISSDRIKADCYEGSAPLVIAKLPAGERLEQPEREIADTIDDADFAREAMRCFSCGSCFGCQRCSMYCNVGGFTRLAATQPGAYFALALDRCEGCGKCIELCPCGFLDKSIAERPTECGSTR
ncbi:MAG: FAD-dependent oxidoreductase [Deltaproteobacteria bacterium]|nr:FAD-dependent oxidoreductase [Deltaproteobacteria bacterium]